jgi:Tol biopolymer transport system component
VLLAPRTFDLLVALAGSNDRLLSKQELLRTVWGDTFVEEASLSFQISTLRKALGEDGTAWIETVPKHGYRFKAPVEVPAPEILDAEPLEAESGVTVAAPPKWRMWGLAGVGVSLLVALAAAMLAFIERKRVAEAVLDVTPITSYPGRETQPSLSPDGTQVAFAWDGNQNGDQYGNFHIYIKLIAQGAPVPLTVGSRSEFAPAWSPDGRWIAFCRDTGEGGEIVVMPSQGGAERVIARPSPTWVPAAYSHLQALSWFPASDALAVVGYPVRGVQDPRSSRDPSGRGGPAVSRHAPNAIYLVPLNGDAARPITSSVDRTWGDALPAVSNDGSYLAFTRTLNQYWVSAQVDAVPLSRANRPVGEPKLLASRLAPREWQIDGLAWSPAGREVLFANRGLWSVPLAGGPPVLAPITSYRPGRFSLSRDGSRLVFATGSSDLDIWRMPGPSSSGTSEQRAAERAPFISTTQLDTNPQYSPDGNRVAFTSASSGRLQIWVCDSNGSNPVQLTNFSVSTGTPRWSPDGRYIAFDSIDAGNGDSHKGDIYVTPVEGGPVRRFTPEDSHEDVPSWSRDGHSIYYESDRTGEFQLWKAGYPSGKSFQITTDGGVSAFESPDGRFVYYAKRGRSGLWRTPVQGGQEELATEAGHPYFWGMSNSGACLLDPFGREVILACLDLATKRLSTVSAFVNDGRIRPTGPSFSVSPDGRWILYSHIEREEADLMLVDNFGAVHKK